MNCPIYDVGVGAGALSCSLIAEILGKDISRGRAGSCHSRDQGPTQMLRAGTLTHTAYGYITSYRPSTIASAPVLGTVWWSLPYRG